MGSKKATLSQRKITSDWKNFFIRAVSMEHKICHTYLSLGSNPHRRKPFFKPKMSPLLGKLKFHQKLCFFNKAWVQKGSHLTKKITSDWKTFFIRGICMEPKLYHTYLSLSSNSDRRKPFFQAKDVAPLGKLKISSKSCFFIKHNFKKAPCCQRKITSD